MSKFKTGVALGIISSVAVMYATGNLKKKAKVGSIIGDIVDKLKN